MVTELYRRGYRVEQCDLTTGDDIVEVCRSPLKTVYDLVVHCAFHVGGRAAIDGDASLLARNLQIDSSLFDWARRTGQGRVLYFSSSAAYPVRLQTEAWSGYRLGEDFICPQRECGPPDGRYGWAKYAGELLAAAAREAGLAVTVCRPFSGYGEDQDGSYPFRAIVERARAREDPFVVWGPGTQVRDWIHIDDCVQGALAVAASGTEDPVNLCTGIGTSMLDLAKMCCERVGYQPTFTPLVDKPTGVAHRVGDPTRFHQYWTPQITLAEGVSRALATALV